jgi:hypothetical protein
LKFKLIVKYIAIIQKSINIIYLNMNNEIECLICYESIIFHDKHTIMLPCKHLFHDKYISIRWAKDTLKSCPYCRCSLDQHQEQLNHEIDCYINKQLMKGKEYHTDIYYLKKQLKTFIQDPIKSLNDDGMVNFILYRNFITLIKINIFSPFEITKMIYDRLISLYKRGYSKIVNDYYVYQI